MKKIKLLPSWTEFQNYFIVYPSMRGKKCIEDFFGLLFTIIDNLDFLCKITIIVSSQEDKEKVLDKIRDNYFLQNKDIICSEGKEERYKIKNLKFDFWKIAANDIWCRDYLPIAAQSVECIAKGEKAGAYTADVDIVSPLALKPIYDPNYGFNTAADNAVGVHLAEKTNKHIKLPFKWDGGNLSTNGEYAIVTNKIFSENWNFRAEELQKYLEEKFITKFIFIPTESLDTIGHADSIAIFLDHKTILLPIYPDDYRVDNRYTSQVYQILLEQLPKDYQFIFLPCDLSDEICEENIFSASGCFLNLFRIKNHLFFPGFSHLREEQNEIKRIILKHNENLQVHFVDCDNISTFGGCWNCCTNALPFKLNFDN